jgi:hypothetical protein
MAVTGDIARHPCTMSVVINRSASGYAEEVIPRENVSNEVGMCGVYSCVQNSHLYVLPDAILVRLSHIEERQMPLSVSDVVSDNNRWGKSQTN